VTPFDRLGRFVARRAWWVVGAWAALLLVAIPFAPRAPGVLSAGGFILDDLESARAKTLLETELGAPPSALVVVFSSPVLLAGTPAFESAAATAMQDVPTAPHVIRVVSHVLAPQQVSRDGHTAYDVILLDLSPDDSPAALPILRERLQPAPGLSVELAGGPAFYGDVQRVSESDLQRSEIISLPLAALALLVVFGSAVAAGVPLAVGGAAVVVALAGIFLVASLTPMSIFVLNLATLLGLGLGVDYSLLLTSRFREELAARPDGPDRVADAVRVTVATAGRAVFFSGLTVLLGLLGLVLFEFMILRSVGIAGAIVVGLAVASGPHAAARDPDDRRHAHRPVRVRPGERLERHRRRVGPPRSTGHAPSRGRARPVARLPAPPRAPVPPRPLQSPRRSRSCPPEVAVARGVRPAPGAVRRGRVRAARAGRPTAGALPTSSANLGRAPRLVADASPRDPRVARVDSLVDVDPRLTLQQYQLLYWRPERPARSVPPGRTRGRRRRAT
jgi:RND superfamily putative drug exporter